MEEKSKFSLIGDMRFIGSSMGVLVGVLALASEAASQQDTLPGWSVLFGALAYRSAKKRKLGLVQNTHLRKGLEAGAILLIAIFMFLTDRSTLVNDPFPHLVLPLWAIIAYIVALVRKS